MKTLALSTLLVTAVVAASPAQSQPNFASLRSAWATSLHRKDLAAAIALYSDHAVFVTPDGSRFVGRRSISKLYQTVTKNFTSTIAFTSLNSYASGDLAYDAGTWRERLTTIRTGKTQSTGGGYATIYRYLGGTWLIVEQIWTQSSGKGT